MPSTGPAASWWLADVNPLNWIWEVFLDVCCQYQGENEWAPDSKFSHFCASPLPVEGTINSAMPGTSQLRLYRKLVDYALFSPVYGPRFQLLLLSSLSESFWQTQGPSNHSSVFYPCLLHSPFPSHLSMKTVPSVRFVESFFLLSLHRGGAEILGREGSWGPDFLLWCHPRRCPSLWAFSQVSASGSLLYLDLQLKGQTSGPHDVGIKQ